MDLLIAVLVVIGAFFVIKAIGISLWTLVGVLAVVALCLFIYRQTRGGLQ